MRENSTVTVEQVAEAEKSLRAFWDKVHASGKFQTVLCLRLSGFGERLVGWEVAVTAKGLLDRTGFTRHAMGWYVERERSALDPTKEHERFTVSKESVAEASEA